MTQVEKKKIMHREASEKKKKILPEIKILKGRHPEEEMTRPERMGKKKETSSKQNAKWISKFWIGIGTSQLDE